MGFKQADSPTNIFRFQKYSFANCEKRVRDNEKGLQIRIFEAKIS